MNILEQLKTEHAQRDGLPVGEPLAGDANSADAPRVVERALERLYAGLERLAEGLRDLQPDVSVDYELDGVGRLTGLRQEEYAVCTLDVALPRFVFSFTCVGAKSISHVVDAAGQKDVIRDALENHGLDVRIDDLSTWRYVITVMPRVAVRLVFEPGPDASSIRITAHNLDGLGVKLYSLHPDVVRDDLLSEIGKLVLRRKNRFAEFAGNTVSGNIREGWQERVRARERSRAKESGTARAQDEPKRSGLLGLLRGRGATAPAPAPVQAPVARASAIAPDLNNLAEPEKGDKGLIEWDGAVPPEPARTPPASVQPVSAASPHPASAPSPHPASTPSSRSASTPPPRPASVPSPCPASAPTHASVGAPPAYAWLITSDVAAADTSASVGRRGPPGADSALTTARVVKEGEQFRLLNRKGQVRFLGMILGTYQGVEPLVDFGVARECFVIQYKRDGKWVRVRPTD